MCRKISASVDGGRAEVLECTDPGARTPIGASGNFVSYSNVIVSTVARVSTNSYYKDDIRKGLQIITLSQTSAFPFS